MEPDRGDYDENSPYTITDLCRELRMEQNTVYLAIKRGALPARKVLGRWLVTPEDFRRVREGEPLSKRVQDMKALKAENERLRADNERLRSHASNIKHLMDGPVQIENTTIWAELCKMVEK